MINLDKLTQFDINNFDASQIIKILTEQQKIIKIILIVGSLVMIGGEFSDHRVKEAGLRAKLTQEQGKLGVIKSRDAAIQDLSNFKSLVSKELNIFDFITLISNYAKSSNSVVISYTPDQSKDMGLYNVIDVRFDVVSDSFKDMEVLLRKIEKSEYPLRINIWSGHERDDGTIGFTIEISAVHIHP